MPDRENVIKGLEYCIKSEDCRGCIYWEGIGLHEGCHLHSDALSLLKEQEAVKPIRKLAYTKQGWFCGNCDNRLNRNGKYCSFCGKPILWEGR